MGRLKLVEPAREHEAQVMAYRETFLRKDRKSVV